MGPSGLNGDITSSERPSSWSASPHTPAFSSMGAPLTGRKQSVPRPFSLRWVVRSCGGDGLAPPCVFGPSTRHTVHGDQNTEGILQAPLWPLNLRSSFPMPRVFIITIVVARQYPTEVLHSDS